MPRRPRLSARDLPSAVFLVAVVVSLLRARDLPSVDVPLRGTNVSVGPVDAALVATGLLALWRLLERRRLPAPGLMVASAVFALYLLASSLANGADAVTSAGRLVELFALALGAVAFVDSLERLRALVGVLAVFCVVAVTWGAIEFVTGGGGRQGSFMGEHDLAALGTLTLVAGLAAVYARRTDPLAVTGVAAGGVAIALGASLATLGGLYLAAAVLIAVALVRGSLRGAAVVATLGVVVAVTAATLTLRSGELGFIQEWFGPEAEQPGQYAASWSQRLIYAYVGGRVFVDQPVLGVGWYGELPPEEYERYLPDARERFSDQPPRYFADLEDSFIPQQAYDQVLIQLGLVGGGLFALLAFLAARPAVRVALRAPPQLLEHALVPIGWLAGMAGALAGTALFGGSPLASLFWLTVGVVGAIPPLVDVQRP